MTATQPRRRRSPKELAAIIEEVWPEAERKAHSERVGRTSAASAKARAEAEAVKYERALERIRSRHPNRLLADQQRQRGVWEGWPPKEGPHHPVPRYPTTEHRSSAIQTKRTHRAMVYYYEREAARKLVRKFDPANLSDQTAERWDRRERADTEAEVTRCWGNAQRRLSRRRRRAVNNLGAKF